MSCYNSFAMVYDIFMKGTPYKSWLKNVLEIWKKYGLEPELVLELACGTGNMTELFSKAGMTMIGLDSSEEMLSEAKKKKHGDKILYLHQDMTDFELFGTVDSIICLCDGMNYIMTAEDLLRIFKLVNNYLNPGGLFIFDLNTEYFFKELLGRNNFSETGENTAYIWENFYDDKEKINEYKLNFFIQNKEGTYDRYEEFHYEKAYSTQEIIETIQASGLTYLEVMDANKLKEPTEKSKRLYFAAKKIREGNSNERLYT